jgi:asparagine synthase (glutamine-hydrolysing)
MRLSECGDAYADASIRDLTGYTKNVLLRDTDAMSMARSLEVRVPYLDDELVEWVLALPGELKAGGGKALLVEAARDLLPEEIFARKKHGFELPIARWMAAELRDEVESKLRRRPEMLEGLLDGDAMTRVWDEFARDGRRWLRPWSLYALCRWAESVAAPARSVAA